MSTTLSITSRQFAPSTRIESQVHWLHSAAYAPSIRGMVTSSGRGFPGEPQAMPAAREPGRRRAAVDGPDAVPVIHWDPPCRSLKQVAPVSLRALLSDLRWPY